MKNLPKEIKDDEIINFLKEVGADDMNENTEIKLERNNKSTTATVEPLTPDAVRTMLRLIHFPETKKKFFNVPLYCRAVRVMTPNKPANDDKSTDANNLNHEDNHQVEATEHFENTESFKPLAEIKSRLFGNASEDDSEHDDDDEDDMNLRDEFLKSDDEFEAVKNGKKKKRGRKSSNENSDIKKHKKKGKTLKIQ